MLHAHAVVSELCWPFCPLRSRVLPHPATHPHTCARHTWIPSCAVCDRCSSRNPAVSCVLCWSAVMRSHGMGHRSTEGCCPPGWRAFQQPVGALWGSSTSPAALHKCWVAPTDLHAAPWDAGRMLAPTQGFSAVFTVASGHVPMSATGCVHNRLCPVHNRGMAVLRPCAATAAVSHSHVVCAPGCVSCHSLGCGWVAST